MKGLWSISYLYFLVYICSFLYKAKRSVKPFLLEIQIKLNSATTYQARVLVTILDCYPEAQISKAVVLRKHLLVLQFSSCLKCLFAWVNIQPDAQPLSKDEEQSMLPK